MKKVLLYSLFVLLLSPGAAAQVPMEDNRMSDKERIALTAIVLDDEIPSGAHKQLVNKMTQIAAKGGCAATDNSRFIITCSADVLTKDITPSAPPMHAYTLNLNFYVGDGVEGRLFSSYTVEAKGVGQTPEKAYLNALKNVRVNDPGFKAMIDKGKQRIIEYYNTQCDFIIADAQAKLARKEYTATLTALSGVPEVCTECYQRSLDLSVETYEAWRDEVCLMALNKAKAAWAKRDADGAAKALEDIPVDGSCASDAAALRKEIAAKLDAKERQEWEFKMQQYEDRMAEREARQREREQQPDYSRAQQVQTNAVQVMQEDPTPAPKPVYQVKGKWFK